MQQHHSKEVVLGFLEKPKNSIELTPEYLPSKLGGSPVSFTKMSVSHLFYIKGMDLDERPTIVVVQRLRIQTIFPDANIREY